MKKTAPKKPYFARFLESQELARVEGGGGPIQTHKYPSDVDEVTTQKWPSDDDEGETS